MVKHSSSLRNALGSSLELQRKNLTTQLVDGAQGQHSAGLGVPELGLRGVLGRKVCWLLGTRNWGSLGRSPAAGQAREVEPAGVVNGGA